MSAERTRGSVIREEPSIPEGRPRSISELSDCDNITCADVAALIRQAAFRGEALDVNTLIRVTSDIAFSQARAGLTQVLEAARDGGRTMQGVHRSSAASGYEELAGHLETFVDTVADSPPLQDLRLTIHPTTLKSHAQNTLCAEDLERAAVTPIPNQAGASEVSILSLDGAHYIQKRFLEGTNRADEHYDLSQGEALQILAHRIDNQTAAHAVFVRAPQVIYQDSSRLVTEMIPGGKSDTPAPSLYVLWSHVRAPDRRDVNVPGQCKHLVTDPPYDERELGRLMDAFREGQKQAVCEFNQLFPAAAAPRGEVATPGEWHLVVADVRRDTGGKLQLFLVLHDLR